MLIGYHISMERMDENRRSIGTRLLGLKELLIMFRAGFWFRRFDLMCKLQLVLIQRDVTEES